MTKEISPEALQPTDQAPAQPASQPFQILHPPKREPVLILESYDNTREINRRIDRDK